jgi:hypothetical protein
LDMTRARTLAVPGVTTRARRSGRRPRLGSAPRERRARGRIAAVGAGIPATARGGAILVGQQFEAAPGRGSPASPKTVSDFAGQDHALSPGRRRAGESIFQPGKVGCATSQWRTPPWSAGRLSGAAHTARGRRSRQ